MSFSLVSKLHPPRPKDYTKWSTWYADVVGFAADRGFRRVPKKVYRELFTQGLSPEAAAGKLK